jgi:hypothetical protein
LIMVIEVKILQPPHPHAKTLVVGDFLFKENLFFNFLNKKLVTSMHMHKYD